MTMAIRPRAASLAAGICSGRLQTGRSGPFPLPSLASTPCSTVVPPFQHISHLLIPSAGFSTFLPTIIDGLGEWSVAQVQLLTIPCYFLGAVAYMAMAMLSDRLQMRGVFCVIFGLVSVLGYAVLLSDSAPGVHYFGCFLVAGGLYVVVGLPIAWVRQDSVSFILLSSNV